MKTDNYEAIMQIHNPKEFPIIPSISNENHSNKNKHERFKRSDRGALLSGTNIPTFGRNKRSFYEFFRRSADLAATDGFRLSERKLNQKQTKTDIEDFSVIIRSKPLPRL